MSVVAIVTYFCEWFENCQRLTRSIINRDQSYQIVLNRKKARYICPDHPDLKARLDTIRYVFIAICYGSIRRSNMMIQIYILILRLQKKNYE